MIRWTPIQPWPVAFACLAVGVWLTIRWAVGGAADIRLADLTDDVEDPGEATCDETLDRAEPYWREADEAIAVSDSGRHPSMRRVVAQDFRDAAEARRRRWSR